jgi:hypothetical protein
MIIHESTAIKTADRVLAGIALSFTLSGDWFGRMDFSCLFLDFYGRQEKH